MVLRPTEKGRASAAAGQLSNHDGAAGPGKQARAAGANRRKRALNRWILKPVNLNSAGSNDAAAQN